MLNPLDALKRAIEIVGGQTALASAIGGSVRQGHVSHWLVAGRVPAEHCPAIERETKRRGETIRCELLCPSADWGVLRLQSEGDEAAPAGEHANASPDPRPERRVEHDIAMRLPIQLERRENLRRVKLREHGEG